MSKALLLSKELGSFSSQAIAYRGISYSHFYRRHYEPARKYADSSLAIAEQHQLKPELQKTYAHLANLSYAVQQHLQGDQYAIKASEISESLLNESIQKRTIEMDKKYQSALKDAQISLQQSSLKVKTSWNYALAGGTAALLLLSMLSYRNYLQRQRIQEQRISELETEKQLAASGAVLRGEEQERTRLAKDLHDGLGGMLSGIKYTLHTVKGNLVLTPENAQSFERSLDMLDSSIREMRRVAHNMMPEALVKFGLDTALQDFCNDINQSGALQVSYQSIGLKDTELEQTKAITIYRIVQELLNNSMKHAAARHALVQISNNENQLSITVEDDGKGFDPAILRQSRGIGWTNIQHRIDFLKGRWDVDSKPGKGTSVHIEFSSS
jgi:signal transduction histidine kinase